METGELLTVAHHKLEVRTERPLSTDDGPTRPILVEAESPMPATAAFADATIVPCGVDCAAECVLVRFDQINLLTAHTAHIIRIAVEVATTVTGLAVLGHAHEVKGRITTALGTAQVDGDRYRFADQGPCSISLRVISPLSAAICKVDSSAVACAEARLSRQHLHLDLLRI